MDKLVKFTILIAVALFITLFGWKKCSGTNEIQVNHDMVVLQIEELGKLEVVKYHIKDIVEYKKVRQWLPNSKTLLIAVGEVTGCIDLAKVKSENIKIQGDSISLLLPAPEICYCKIDHQKSRVYNVEYGFWETSELVDEAYRQAESQLYAEASNMNIEAESKQNAVKLLTPILNGMGFKKVNIGFKIRFSD